MAFAYCVCLPAACARVLRQGPTPCPAPQPTNQHSNTPTLQPQVVPQRSVLDALLLGEWEDRAEAGLFRYDVTACPTKLVPGSYGFVAQCNEGRLSKKRPTEFLIDQVGGRVCVGCGCSVSV